MTTLLAGIDVSAWQPHIDWRKVAQAERYDPEAQAEHFARTIGTCGLSLEGAVTSEVDP